MYGIICLFVLVKLWAGCTTFWIFLLTLFYDFVKDKEAKIIDRKFYTSLVNMVWDFLGNLFALLIYLLDRIILFLPL